MTVDRAFAERIIAGNGFLDGGDTPSPSNPRVVEITEYRNVWGGVSYGCTFEGQANRYAPSTHVIAPRLYWRYEAPKAVVA